MSKQYTRATVTKMICLDGFLADAEVRYLGVDVADLLDKVKLDHGDGEITLTLTVSALRYCREPDCGLLAHARGRCYAHDKSSGGPKVKRRRGEDLFNDLLVHAERRNTPEQAAKELGMKVYSIYGALTRKDRGSDEGRELWKRLAANRKPAYV